MLVGVNKWAYLVIPFPALFIVVKAATVYAVIKPVQLLSSEAETATAAVACSTLGFECLSCIACSKSSLHHESFHTGNNEERPGCVEYAAPGQLPSFRIYFYIWSKQANFVVFKKSYKVV